MVQLLIVEQRFGSGFWFLVTFLPGTNNRRERDMAEKEGRNCFARTRKFHEQQPNKS
jgi:hypothetical protein